MTGSLRILLVTPMNPSAVGGISTVVRNLKKGLVREGHEVQTLFVPFEKSERDWKLTDYVPRPRWCYSFKAIKTRRFAFLQNIYRRARSAIRSFDPDIVHAMHIWCWPAIVVADRLDIPTVVSTHALELEEKALAVRAIADVETVHSVSNFTRGLVNGIFDNRFSSYIAPPSIELDKYRRMTEPPEDDPELVVSLSRFVDRKNLETVIKAWKHVDTESTDRQLIIAGAGPNKESLTKLAENIDEVSIIGKISETRKRELFAQADVFALVPRRDGFDVEGFGIVYVEAQAANTPVVGSVHGGAPEAIGDGGLVVEQEDDPVEVADAMVELLNNQKRRQQCLKAIGNRIEKFDLRPVARNHIKSYRENI